MLVISEKIFNRLMEEKVNYCHWKSNEHLEEGLNGETDLDILVSEADKNRFANILIECKCLKVQPQYGSRYPKVEEWIGFDDETGKLIHWHVHFRMITGTKHLKEYVFPWHQLALDTKIPDESGKVYIIEPNLELVILYMRIVLKQQTIEETNRFVLDSDYRKEIQWLKQRVNSDSLSKLLNCIWKEKQDEVLTILMKTNPSKKDFAAFQKLTKEKAQSMKTGSAVGNAFLYRVRSQSVSTKRLIKRKCGLVPFSTLKTLNGRGVIFAFIGCDGSGKSNVTDQICKWLGWKLDCQNFYFGMGERYKKPLIYKMAQSHIMPETLRRVCNMLFYFQISVRCKRLRRQMDRYVGKGGIAICDRYPQAQVKGIYDGPKIQALHLCNDTVIGKLLAHIEEKNISETASKRVDGMFKLILPAEAALKRSPGHHFQEVKRKAKITKKLQFANADVFEIDATQYLEDELLEIRRIIWNKLLEGQQ